MFDASQSYDPEGAALSTYLWDFGDVSPPVFAVAVCHTYHYTYPYYQTILWVDDECGAGDVDAVSISVIPPTNHAPVASPTAARNTGPGARTGAAVVASGSVARVVPPPPGSF